MNCDVTKNVSTHRGDFVAKICYKKSKNMKQIKNSSFTNIKIVITENVA